VKDQGMHYYKHGYIWLQEEADLPILSLPIPVIPTGRLYC